MAPAGDVGGRDIDTLPAAIRDTSFDLVISPHGTRAVTVTTHKTLDYSCSFIPMMTIVDAPVYNHILAADLG